MSPNFRSVPGPAEVQDLELRAVLRFFRRNWIWLAFSGVAAVAVGVGALVLLQPYYVATTTLIVDNRRPRSPTDQTPVVGDQAYVDTQIATIQSDLILEQIVKDLNLTEDPEFDATGGILPRLANLLLRQSGENDDDPQLQTFRRERIAIGNLRQSLDVARVGTSYVVDVSVRSSDPDKAAHLANAVAGRFVEDQKNFSIRVTERSNPEIAARVISPATHPFERAGPRVSVVLGGALFAGLGFGMVAAFLRETLDRRLRTIIDVEKATTLECLGLVPLLNLRGMVAVPANSQQENSPRRSRRAKMSDLHVLQYAVEHPGSRFTETIRLMLAFIAEKKNGTGPTVIGFGSAITGVGQSTLSANCALLAAKAGERTLLIDADTHSADLTTRLKPLKENGILDFVTGCKNPSGQSGTHTSLHFLPLDISQESWRLSIPPAWLNDVISRVGNSYDLIFVDLPPLLLSGDARGFARSIDGLILIAEWARTRPDELMEGLRSVPAPEEKVLGVVLNKVRNLGPELYS
jgi:capsular polysaccharide biosynthesis protein/Mrp family chromosome partitioning ATPase